MSSNIEKFLSRTLFILIVALAASLFNARPALAQTDYGSIDGVVGISATNPLPGVTVTLTRLSTNQEQTTTTDSAGRYSFSALEPDTYSVRAQGTTVVVRLFSGQGITRDLRLGPGLAAITEAAPPSVFAPLRANRGRLGINLGQPEIENSPGRGRDAQASLLQAPGANANEAGGISFNGVPDDQTVFRVNGVDTTPLVFLSSSSFQDTRSFSLGQKVPISFTKLNELGIDTSNYPTYLGTGTGGQISTDIKKGSKKKFDQFPYAGDLYTFFSDDGLNARNSFDVNQEPSFRYSQFGFQFGGPVTPKNKTLFFYINYEGVRVRTGAQLFEAVPSAAARLRASPTVASLFPAFNAVGGTIVEGASADPANYDIIELNSKNTTNRNGVAFHLDLTRGNNLGSFIYIREHTYEDSPEGVTGRRQIKRDIRQTGILRYHRTFEGGVVNEAIFGVNSSPVRLGGRFSSPDGSDLSQSTILIRGDVGQSGIVGQPARIGIASVGGLLRTNRAFTGRGLHFTPYNFQFNDNVVLTKIRNHTLTFGGGLRILRTYMNVLNGTTYTFSNLENFLQATPASVQYLGDLGSPSPVGATPSGERKAEQEYYILYGQDQWKIRNHIYLTYGVRYENYTVLRESQDRAVVFDIDEGEILPPQTPFYKSAKANFAPRVAIAWVPRFECKPDNCKFEENSMVLSASFGVHLGPSPFLDQAKPIESDRIINVTQPGGTYPSNPDTLAADFLNNPSNHQFQPLAIARDYTNVERVYKYDVSLKRPLFKGFSFLASYVGNQGRNLLLRNFANRIEQVFTDPDPTKTAIVRRQFDVVQGNNIFKPFGEIDYRTSGGRSSHNSFQFTLRGAYAKSLPLLDVQYTLASTRDNTNGGAKTVTTGNPFDYDYDWGYGPDDARHKFSVKALYSLPFGRGRQFFNGANGLVQDFVGNWSVAGFVDLQSGKPIDIRLARPDVVYVDAGGNVFTSPGVGRSAVVNTPGGGFSVGVRRPDLIPGVDPYLRNDLTYLNPAAFAIPAPGSFGNLRRGDLRGPKLKIVDLVIRKQLLRRSDDKVPAAEFRVEVSNLFNWVNYDRPGANLSSILGTDAAQNQLQPGQPFTTAAAGSSFGLINRNFKRDQDLGASRQIKLALIININGGK